MDDLPVSAVGSGLAAEGSGFDAVSVGELLFGGSFDDWCEVA